VSSGEDLTKRGGAAALAENVRSASLCQTAGPGHPVLVKRVTILAFAGGQSLDAVGPYEVFAGANEALTRGGKRPAYRVELVSLDGRRLVCDSGLALIPRRALGAAKGPLDTLVVAGGAGARAAALVPRVQQAVLRVAPRGPRGGVVAPARKHLCQ
jgi:transcriptional regulator GlxA family with amidase domain